MGQKAAPEKPKQEPKPFFVWARPKFFAGQRPIRKSATCRFKQSVITMMLNAGKDYHPAVEYIRADGDEADTVSFADLDTENPKVVSNGGQASLVVLMRTERAITLAQTRTYGEASAGEFEAYTIFPESGVVIHSTHHMVGVHPSGVTEMGWCN